MRATERKQPDAEEIRERVPLLVVIPLILLLLAAIAGLVWAYRNFGGVASELQNVRAEQVAPQPISTRADMQLCIGTRPVHALLHGSS